MAPTTTESNILRTYLLEPASLPTILSYSHFLALFPTQHRENSQIQVLYRDLQFLRTVDMDVVQENIAAECKKGDRMKLELLRAQQVDGRNHGGTGEYRAADMDMQLFGPAGSLPKRDRRHSVDSLLREMEHICQELETEAQHVESEAGEVLRHMQEIVGGLSDLRYGKFAKTPSMEIGGMEGEVVVALKSLEDVCDRVGRQQQQE